jgi:hypothetical protein
LTVLTRSLDFPVLRLEFVQLQIAQCLDVDHLIACISAPVFAKELLPNRLTTLLTGVPQSLR